MNNKVQAINMKVDCQPALAPKLRFPDFRDAPGWNLVALQESSVPVAERVGQRKLTPVSISAGIGFVPQSEKFGRDISGNQYQLYTLVRDGDFVFNKGNSLKFPQGCVYLLQGWGQVAAPNVFICFRLKHGYSNGFFQNCFEQNQHGKQLQKHITSGARSNGLLNISKETFFGVEIPTPSLAEQQKIADFLSSVDDIIAGQARKLDALKTHKKGLAQQLFPREGETEPRLRFPEFQNAGAWEEKQLGDMCVLVRGPFGGSLKKEIFVESGYAVYEQSHAIYGDFTSFRYYIPVAKYDELKRFSVMPGDIIMSCSGTMGKFAIVPQGARLGVINQALLKLSVRRGGIPVFLKEVLELPTNQEQLLSQSAGGAIKNVVSVSQIKELELLIPSLPEQQRIVDCLSCLDDLIAAQSAKLEALTTYKKGLMQQLFPSRAEVEA